MDPINAELGQAIGLAPGDTVELVTDTWSGEIGSRGDRGLVIRFHQEAGLTFVYVKVDNELHDQPFFFDPTEIKKVKAEERVEGEREVVDEAEVPQVERP
ncbi:hypothetical protein [Streptomyces niveus]|uniref:hypothetical protein n=1 Tax=Streptomyces niveus TaxID=193462 RepID=UPI0035DCF4D1